MTSFAYIKSEIGKEINADDLHLLALIAFRCSWRRVISIYKYNRFGNTAVAVYIRDMLLNIDAAAVAMP